MLLGWHRSQSQDPICYHVTNGTMYTVQCTPGGGHIDPTSTPLGAPSLGLGDFISVQVRRCLLLLGFKQILAVCRCGNACTGTKMKWGLQSMGVEHDC